MVSRQMARWTIIIILIASIATSFVMSELFGESLADRTIYYSLAVIGPILLAIICSRKLNKRLNSDRAASK